MFQAGIKVIYLVNRVDFFKNIAISPINQCDQ